MSWVADRTIGWRILLVAELEKPPTELTELTERLADLYSRQGWGHPADVVSATSVAQLMARLTTDSVAPLLVGHTGSSVVLSAHHRDCDGLGLLTALGALTGLDVTSSARGIDARPGRRRLSGIVSRLAEALLAPPAQVHLAPGGAEAAGDSFADGQAAQTMTTAELVLAGVAAVTSLAPDRPGPRDGRIAIAVGVARRAPADDHLIRDRSELLRLRGVSQATPVATLLRTAPLEAAVGGPRSSAGGGAVDRAASAVITRLRPRLGSTLLVSHLGAVSAPGVVRLSFYPVTAGGSGISVGGLTVEGRTVVTARARAADVTHSELARLITVVAAPRPR